MREGIRSDHIQWLEPGQSPVCDDYLEVMDGLRQQLNRELFLGLEEFECHFAFYPPGAFYQTHLDRFRDDDSRSVTAVLYLNPDWQPAHAGELRMHMPDGSQLDAAAGRQSGGVPFRRVSPRGAGHPGRSPVTDRLVPSSPGRPAGGLTPARGFSRRKPGAKAGLKSRKAVLAGYMPSQFGRARRSTARR